MDEILSIICCHLLTKVLVIIGSSVQVLKILCRSSGMKGGVANQYQIRSESDAEVRIPRATFHSDRSSLLKHNKDAYMSIDQSS